MGKLDGKVAVVTGASHGIGEGIAKVFAGYGAKVVLVARGKQVLGLADSMKAQGFDTVGFTADVSDFAAVEKVAAEAASRYGRIDVLADNAGICVLEDFLAPDNKNRDRHIDINIKGVWNMTKAVIPYMKKNGGGSVVITSSVTGDMVADPGEAAYATTKAALVGFTKVIAREFAKDGIRANAICPGYVMTPLVQGMAEQSNPGHPELAIKGIADAIPLGRLADPAEIGELAAFLASSESSYITGAQIVIDGGSTLPETLTMGV